MSVRKRRDFPAKLVFKSFTYLEGNIWDVVIVRLSILILRGAIVRMTCMDGLHCGVSMTAGMKERVLEKVRKLWL